MTSTSEESTWSSLEDSFPFLPPTSKAFVFNLFFVDREDSDRFTSSSLGRKGSITTWRMGNGGSSPETWRQEKSESYSLGSCLLVRMGALVTPVPEHMLEVTRTSFVFF
jgi:hypothetical protein